VAKKRKATKATQSTQHFIEIAEVKEDVVVLKDGTLRAVLLVSSINFALKADDEQNAIIQSYMSFLNSLDFPLQVVIQSRRLNIGRYLERLAVLEREQTNELLKMQTAEYRQYIRELVELGQIMNKRFFVVVPYNPDSDKQKGFLARFREALRPTAVVGLSQERFRRHRHELMQRIEHIIGGLNSMGLEVAVLDTQSLIELYYNTYNPELANVAPLVEVGQLQVEDVGARPAEAAA
jgi:type IV secretory pathway VirB4 component